MIMNKAKVRAMCDLADTKNLVANLSSKINQYYPELVDTGRAFLELILTYMESKRLLTILIARHMSIFQVNFGTTNISLIINLLQKKPSIVYRGKVFDLHTEWLPVQLLVLIQDRMNDRQGFWDWLFSRIQQYQPGYVVKTTEDFWYITKPVLLFTVSYPVRSVDCSLMEMSDVSLSLPRHIFEVLLQRQRWYVGNLKQYIKELSSFPSLETDEIVLELPLLVVQPMSNQVPNDDDNAVRPAEGVAETLCETRVKLYFLPRHRRSHVSLLPFYIRALSRCTKRVVEGTFCEVGHIMCSHDIETAVAGTAKNATPSPTHRTGVCISRPGILPRNMTNLDNTVFRLAHPVSAEPPVIHLPSMLTPITKMQRRALEVLHTKMTQSVEKYMGPFLRTLDNTTVYHLDRGTVPVKVSLAEVRKWSSCYRALLGLDTGTGKTLVTIAAAMHFMATFPGTKALLLVPDNLLQQWLSEIKKHTSWRLGIDVDFMARGQDVKRVLNKKKTCPVQFRSLKVFLASVNAVRQPDFSELLFNVEFLSIDEVHSVNVDTLSSRCLLNRSFQFIMGISATPYANWRNTRKWLGLKKWMQRSLEAVEIYGTNTDPSFDTEHRKILLPADEWTQAAHKLLAGITTKLTKIQGSVRKITRIYERICAGGRVDGELLMAVLQKMLSNRSVENSLFITEEVCKTKCFSASHDECPICLCNFDKPLQLECGHCLCSVCTFALFSLFRKQCPQCRKELSQPIKLHRPVWYRKRTRSDDDDDDDDGDDREQKGQDCSSGNDFQNRVSTIVHSANRVYHEFLKGGENLPLELTAKKEGFKKYMENYMQHKRPDSRLVIFSKRDVPLANYLQLMKETTDLKVLCAGSFKTGRSDSMQNIEKFRKGEVDVLVCNFRYCTGFDLVNASHILVTDFDISVASLVQAFGRANRIGQRNSKIYIDTLLIENGFDHYLYEDIQKFHGKINTNNIAQVEYFVTHQFPETPMGRAYKVVRNVVGDRPFEIRIRKDGNIFIVVQNKVGKKVHFTVETFKDKIKNCRTHTLNQLANLTNRQIKNIPLFRRLGLV